MKLSEAIIGYPVIHIKTPNNQAQTYFSRRLDVPIPAIGHIVGFDVAIPKTKMVITAEKLRISVRWADGSISSVYPETLEILK